MVNQELCQHCGMDAYRQRCIGCGQFVCVFCQAEDHICRACSPKRNYWRQALRQPYTMFDLRVFLQDCDDLYRYIIDTKGRTVQCERRNVAFKCNPYQARSRAWWRVPSHPDYIIETTGIGKDDGNQRCRVLLLITSCHTSQQQFALPRLLSGYLDDRAITENVRAIVDESHHFTQAQIDLMLLPYH